MLRQIALSGDPDDWEQRAVVSHVRQLVEEARAPAPIIRPAPVFVRLRRGRVSR